MTTESNCVVDLNVGGLLYTTSIDTLTKVNIKLSTFSFSVLYLFIHNKLKNAKYKCSFKQSCKLK